MATPLPPKSAPSPPKDPSPPPPSPPQMPLTEAWMLDFVGNITIFHAIQDRLRVRMFTNAYLNAKNPPPNLLPNTTDGFLNATTIANTTTTGLAASPYAQVDNMLLADALRDELAAMLVMVFGNSQFRLSLVWAFIFAGWRRIIWNWVKGYLRARFGFVVEDASLWG
ncbi:hypothetical protein HK57_00260 [Aspergillus ustus]|uniref:Uncharacterized protein n=1 Tax=Aspergillus ustus TaxID=40382 RepID=A0A0C1E753_ASPUT|nr:hypothetical protein HK57_00260 [Aspergillus ustus]